MLGIVPCLSYLIVYFIEVVLIGETNGGWPDIYRVSEYSSPALAIPGFLLLAFGVSTAVALLSNCLTKKRNKNMYLLWNKDLDPIEVKIEAFGMGSKAAMYSEENNVQIPCDILKDLAEMYHVDAEELMRAFVKGMMTR